MGKWVIQTRAHILEPAWVRRSSTWALDTLYLHAISANIQAQVLYE